MHAPPSDLEAHRMIREITGIGEGKGPYILIDDGFGGLTSWAGLLPNVDRVAIDTHPYFAFSGSANDDPVNTTAPDGQMGGIWPGRACSTWADNLNSMYATISMSFRYQEIDQLFQAKPDSVSVSPENTATVSMTVGST